MSALRPSAPLALALLCLSCAAAFAAAPLPQTHEKATIKRLARPPLRKSEAEPTPAPGLQYRSIGPAISGGRVAAAAGSDRDPMLYYIGAAAGGVFRSTNGGISWDDVWKKQPFGSIGALAIDPRDDRIVWAGTGESNPRNDLSWGDGIWRSNDGAKNWRRMGLEDTSQIARISVAPRDSNDVVVAALGTPWSDSAERGVYRTRDGGKSWSKTLYLDPVTGAADLARDPRDPNVLYAAMWRFRRQPWIASSGGGASGLFKSVDGGTTWRRISGHGFPAPPLGRIGIGVAPGKPSRVYAVIQSKEGTIWRSDDSGANWRLVSRNTMPEQRPFYFSHLAVDPKDPNHVISVSMFLTESKDGGRTWKHVTDALHTDNHALWWSADGRRLLDGNDGGIALSNDGGETWAAPLVVAIGQIYHAGYDLREPYDVCGGFQDNGVWCGPSNSPNGTGILDRDWFAAAGGDGQWVLPVPSDPDKIWTEAQGGTVGIFDKRTTQFVDVQPYPGTGDFTSLDGIAAYPYRFNWDSPLAFSPQDPKTVFFGGNVVFQTNDEGRTWKTISPDLTRNEKEHQRASGGPINFDVTSAEYYDTLMVIAPAPSDAKTIWTGSDDGLVHLTRDGGGAWKDVTPAQLPHYARIEAIDVSATDPATAYIAADRHDLGDRAPYVFVTTDAGASWRRIDAGLPRDASSHVVRIDPKNDRILYVGTENGVWYSPNAGASWLPLKFNLPAVPVYDLQIHPVANDLIVATHGRSFWILDDLTPIQQAAQIGAGPYLFPLRPGVKWWQWSAANFGDSVPDDVFTGRNPRGPALITFWQRTPAKTRPAIEIVDASGTVVRHLSGSYINEEGEEKFWVTNAAGYNRLAWSGAEDGPVRWTGTSFQNAGPLAGPDALPGTYTVRLSIDGRTFTQPFVLRADPRSPWSMDELIERHAYEAKLNAQLSHVNALLNRIDALERPLRKSRDPKAAARIAELDAARDMLTSNALYDEDEVGKVGRIREMLGSAMGLLSGSFQPPFAAHEAYLDRVEQRYDEVVPKAEAIVR